MCMHECMGYTIYDIHFRTAREYYKISFIKGKQNCQQVLLLITAFWNLVSFSNTVTNPHSVLSMKI